MKRTKNMVFKPSIEADELHLYADNLGTLYSSRIKPVIDNLRRKYAKGCYDADKAVDAYYPILCEASELYYRDFGYRFTVTERFTAAVLMERSRREQVEYENEVMA